MSARSGGRDGWAPWRQGRPFMVLVFARIVAGIDAPVAALIAAPVVALIVALIAAAVLALITALIAAPAVDLSVVQIIVSIS